MGKLKYNYNRVQFTSRNNELKDYGFTSYQDFLKSDFWKAMREKLRSKPQFKKCYCCGSEDRIELHHFKYKNFLDGSSSKNIAPTCRNCHEKIHKLSREKNITFKHAARKIRQISGYKITYTKVIKPKLIFKKEIAVKKGIKKYVILGEGRECPKCRKPMQRRTHSETPIGKTYYFLQWDYCKPCGHVQHYDEFKRQNK